MIYPQYDGLVVRNQFMVLLLRLYGRRSWCVFYYQVPGRSAKYVMWTNFVQLEYTHLYLLLFAWFFYSIIPECILIPVF